MNIKSFNSFAPDNTLPEEMRDRMYKFLGEDLLCLPGRADFKKGRFMIVPIRNHEDMEKSMQEFEARLRDGLKSTACLMIIEPDSVSELVNMSCSDITTYVQEKYFEPYYKPRFTYEDGTKTYPRGYTVQCPVTNAECYIDDFNMALFMPQTENRDDPLYDPPHYAPYPSIQTTSDMLSFSMFVADLCKKRHDGRAPFQLSTHERETLFDQGLASFQKLAVQTISDFAKAIDPKLRCPMRILNGNKRYYADHHGVALGEVAKGNFTLSLPNEYGTAIIEQWKEYFETGKKLDFSSITAETGCERIDDVALTHVDGIKVKPTDYE